MQVRGKYSHGDSNKELFTQFNSLESKFISKSKRIKTRQRNISFSLIFITILGLLVFALYTRAKQREAEKTQRELVQKIIENGIVSANALKNEGKYQQALEALKTTNQLPGIHSEKLDSLFIAWTPLTSTMNAADSMQNKGKYKEAILLYQKALTILSGDRRIIDKLARTDKLLNNKFADLKKKGIGFMTFGEFQLAITRFEQGLRIKEDRELQLLLDSCINELSK